MNSTKKSIQLTPAMLRALIEEEVSKGFGKVDDVEDRADDAEETDADEFADSVERPVDWKKANAIKETLDEHIDMMKALKLEETRLVRRLAKVKRALSEGAKKLLAARVV